jgi:RNA polymerase sigma-70 factor (ECF subfamily)
MRERGDWSKLACLELVIVRGWTNKQAAAQLQLSEQTVANFKFEFLERLRTIVRQQHLNPDVFPELYDEA